MFEEYCDFDNEAIINYIDNFYRDLYGMDKIKKIFIDIKNSICYDPFSCEQKASQTLVMSRGNNFDKSILLYTMLKMSDFDCKLTYKIVKDNSKLFISRQNNSLPWFYTQINYFGKEIPLDCSFDESYMRASGIMHYGTKKDYSIEDYAFNGKPLFTISSKQPKDEIDYMSGIDNLLKTRGETNCTL